MKSEITDLVCPFNWNVPSIGEDRLKFLLDLNDKDEMYFLMSGITVKLINIFENARQNDYTSAITLIEELKLELTNYIPAGNTEVEDKYLLNRSKEGIWLVILSTEAYVTNLMNNIDKLNELISNIKPFESLNESNKAAVFGIKCRFLMEYGPYETTEKAIIAIRNAIILDDSVLLWKSYLGKCLARHRRATAAMDPPSEEEITMLEKAFTSKTPNRGVILLHSYANLYTSLFHHNKNSLHKNIVCKSSVEKKIIELLRYVINTNNDRWYIYWRCASIAMKLPRGLIKNSEIKSLLDSAEKHSHDIDNPNKLPLYDTMSKYYIMYEKKYNLALKFANKAAEGGLVGACIKVIRLKFWMVKDTDLIPVIDGFIDQFKNNQNNMYTFIIIKADYLLLKNKINDAILIYLKAMESNSKMYQILNWNGIFNEPKGVNNLYNRLDSRLNSLKANTDDGKLKIIYQGYIDKILYYKMKSIQ